MIGVVTHPEAGPCTIANTIRVIPTVAVNAEGNPNERVPVLGESAVSSGRTKSTAMAASGTLTKNTAAQPYQSVSTPPSREPRIIPLPPAVPHTAKARCRARPSAKLTEISVSVAGNNNAPPRPCPARAATNSPGEVARPPASEATP